MACRRACSAGCASIVGVMGLRGAECALAFSYEHGCRNRSCHFSAPITAGRRGERVAGGSAELSPEFVASIERGKADIAAGRARVVRP
jgi:hypothetical protein